MPLKYVLICCFFFLTCKVDQVASLANKVQVRLEGEPDQLNPILTSRAFTKQIEWQIFMPLLQFDSKLLNLYPVLAMSRPIVETIKDGDNAGGRKYTFEIRAEAKWDDGVDVTGADVVFTLKAFLYPNICHPGLRSFLSFISDLEIDPKNKKRFSVITNVSFNLAEAVIGTMAIYPKHLYDPLGIFDSIDLQALNEELRPELNQDSSLIKFVNDFKNAGRLSSKNKIYGCGPYKLKEWDPGERIVLSRKENWWGDKLEDTHQSFQAEPDQLLYNFIKDDITLSTMVRSEVIDVASAIDPIVFDELKQSQFVSDRYNFHTPISPEYYFIALNTKSEKLKDKAVRKAINHLIDIDQLIEIVMKGYAIPTTGPILPIKSYYNNELTSIKLNVDQAKNILNAAGWVDSNNDGVLDKIIDGEVIDFSLSYKYASSNSIGEQVGFILKENANKIGVKIKLEPLEFGKLISDTRSRAFELYFSRWSQMPGLDDLKSIWHSSSDTPRGFNKVGFGNVESDSIIDAINVELDDQKRKELYYQIQAIIYDECPYIFLFVPKDRIIIHEKFKATTTSIRPGFFENTFFLKD